jgi:hypothetical protein
VDNSWDSLDCAYALVDGWEQLPAGVLHLDVVDVAIDQDGSVYVLARDEAQILVYDQSGVFRTRFGGGVLSSRPHGLTLGPDGMVYCVDEDRHCVFVFGPDGSVRDVIGIPGSKSASGHDQSKTTLFEKVATIVRAAPPFNRPTKLSVGRDGVLFVADGYGNCRVHAFSPEGALIRSWGEPGVGPGQFHLPHSVCALDDGRVLIADRENERIQVFWPDGSFIESWDDVQRPTAVVQGPGQLLYVSELGWVASERSWTHGEVSEPRPARLSVFGLDGGLVHRWVSPGNGAGPGEFIAPHGLAVDSNGDIYIAEAAETYRRSRNWEFNKSSPLQKFSPRCAPVSE